MNGKYQERSNYSNLSFNDLMNMDSSPHKNGDPIDLNMVVENVLQEVDEPLK